MSSCDFMVTSCSSAEFHTLSVAPSSKFPRSPSMPDVNGSALHEIIDTVLASSCHSFSYASRNQFAEWQKFRSPISISLMVLKARFLALKRRVCILEDENGSLKLSNAALHSKIATLNGNFSILRADHHELLCDRKKLALTAEQDQQKIRALTSDIDNAQQFIMAMVDLKLHEIFLHAAANQTMARGKDAEQSLAKAIAQEADREGSLWSRILSFVIDVRSANSYGDAVALALQTKENSSGDDEMIPPTRSGAELEATNAFPPSPEFRRVVEQVTSEGRRDSFSSVHDSRSSSPSETRSRPPTPFMPSRQRTRVSHVRSNQTSNCENLSMKAAPKSAASQTAQWSETQKQSQTKNSDKCKGVIISNNAAIVPNPQHKDKVEAKTSVFTALGSLERICALLSNSDLGSLEETTDDDESHFRASRNSGDSLDVAKEILFGEAFAEGVSDATFHPNTETVTEKNGSSAPYFIPDCPELSPSISTSPPSTPLGSVFSYFPERILVVDTSPTEFGGVSPTVRPETIAYQDSPASKCSLNLPKLPMVSSIAKRLSRVVTKVEVTSNGSVPSSLFGNTRLRSSSSPSAITRLKNASPKTSRSESSTIIPPARQKLSSKPIPSKKTGKTVSSTPLKVSEVPASPAKRIKAANPKPEAGATRVSNSAQELKVSVGRNFLRRLSNIPGSVSKPRFTPAASQASPNQTPSFLVNPSPSPAPTKSRSQSASDSSSKCKPFIHESPPAIPAANTTVSTHTNISTALTRKPPTQKTKPRSNTVNDFSPVKPSPLSQNSVSASAERRDSRSSWQRQSIQVVVSTVTPVAPPRFPERSQSAKRQVVKNVECNPPATPTAAFMKPVNKSATKAAKRMTNSIKPLIPTWTAGSPSQCDDMFRNSLSMIVR